jgi:hypothetical protein
MQIDPPAPQGTYTVPGISANSNRGAFILCGEEGGVATYSEKGKVTRPYLRYGTPKGSNTSGFHQYFECDRNDKLTGRIWVFQDPEASSVHLAVGSKGDGGKIVPFGWASFKPSNDDPFDDLALPDIG